MRVFIVFISFLIINCSFGQLVVSTSQSASDLVQKVLLGPGVTVSNIQYSGAANTIGSFSAANTNLGISSGIMMTTGTLLNNGNGPQGPNNKAGATFDNNAPGFNLLTNLLGGTATLNSAYLQMDFVPQSDTVRFKYVFGSEEYPEFAPPNNAKYNDVFAFFISGPGISGQQNIASLSNGTAVSINNINAITNSSYYIGNGDGATAPYNSSANYIQYDGFTKVLEAVSKVQCGQTYHLILAIADVGDAAFDSGIFLEANSLKANVDFVIDSKLSYQAYPQTNLMAEGCVSSTLIIKRNGSHLPAVTIPINVSGSATKDVDYDGVPSSIVFSQGETQKQIIINALGDNNSEVIETILLSFLIKDACGNDKNIDLELDIKDPDPLSVTVQSGNPVCPGDDIEVVANVSGGVGPFKYIWNTGETTSSIFVSPTSSSVYTVTISDDCLVKSATDDGTVSVPNPDPLDINQTPNITEICPNITKVLEANAIGGTAPYTYEWTTSDQSKLGTNSTQEVTPFVSTTYKVQVIDRCGEMAFDNIIYTITSPELKLEMPPNIEICPGDSVLVWVKPSGGHPVPDWKYFYSWKGNNIKDSSFWVNPMVTSTYEVSVSDSCQTFTVEGNTTITVVKPIADFTISSHTLFENLPITFQNLSQNGSYYNWTFGDGNSSTMVHPNNTYLDPGTYIVNLIAKDEKGCMDSIKKPITIEEEYYVYIPNTFTPDGGRMNEAFKVSTIGISSLEIIICNRWGEIVFSSQDQYFRWDGTYNGTQSKVGVYTYKVKCITNSKIPLEFRGHVTLLK